ncbi:MAG: molybdenum cofactor biosynthesis protein MoaE [Salibacteraceae bacterium]
MKHKTPKNIFKDGPITPESIAKSIANHQVKTDIGAHQIFMGQVRADDIDGKKVIAIDYSAYEEMAMKEVHVIREEAFEKYDLSCMHIYHSLGRVNTGEICLFVFVSSPHRRAAIEACEFLVENIKKSIPIFGKEVLENEEYVWKENK